MVAIFSRSWGGSVVVTYTDDCLPAQQKGQWLRRGTVRDESHLIDMSSNKRRRWWSTYKIPGLGFGLLSLLLGDKVPGASAADFAISVHSECFSGLSQISGVSSNDCRKNCENIVERTRPQCRTFTSTVAEGISQANLLRVAPGQTPSPDWNIQPVAPASDGVISSRFSHLRSFCVSSASSGWLGRVSRNRISSEPVQACFDDRLPRWRRPSCGGADSVVDPAPIKSTTVDRLARYLLTQLLDLRTSRAGPGSFLSKEIRQAGFCKGPSISERENPRISSGTIRTSCGRGRCLGVRRLVRLGSHIMVLHVDELRRRRHPSRPDRAMGAIFQGTRLSGCCPRVGISGRPWTGLETPPAHHILTSTPIL